MAYSVQDDEEQQGQGLNQTLNQQGQPQPQQQAPEEPQPVQSSGQASTIGAAQPAQPAQPKQQKAGTGTFTNLRNYLQANQGNRLASAAGQRVQNAATGAQKGIQQATSAFGQRVEQGSLADRQKAVQDVTNIAQAGRQVKYQAPQAQPAQQPTAPGATQPAQAAPAATPAEQAFFDAAQEKRFADVINAQYKGPQSLQQAGLYDQTAKKVATASQAAKNTQTALGREQLLRDMFSKNRDYSIGQSRLDALLLNTSAPGVQQLQTAAKPASEVQAQLEQAQTGSSNLAANRAREIADIQQQAREAFTGQQSEQAKSVEDRITAMTTQPVIGEDGKPVMKADGTPMTEWDRIPEYFKNVIAQNTKSNTEAQAAQMKALQDKKAAIQAEYAKKMGNVGGSTIGRIINKKRLQKELASKLAKVDAESKNLSKAAKQQLSLSAEEAAVLGLGAGEGIFNLGQNLVRTQAADREALVSKDEVARQNALARLAGLDTSGTLSTAKKYGMDKAGTQSAMSALDTKAIRDQLNETKKLFEQKAKTQNITGTGSKKNKTSGKRYYASETQNLGKLLEKAGYDFKAPESTQVGDTDILKRLSGEKIGDEDPMSAVDQLGLGGIQDVATGKGGRSIAADLGNVYGANTGINAITNALGLGNLGSAVGGFFGAGSSSKESKSDAARMARQDLQRRVAKALDQSGIYNRANIVDNEQSKARLEALKALLASRDKTNA